MKNVYIQTASFSRIIGEQFDHCVHQSAKMGYRGIELFGGFYGGHSSSELKSMTDALGLEIIGVHVNLDKTDEQLEYVAGLGTKYFICPGVHIGSHDEALVKAEELNKAGEKAKAAGLKYGYHNHNNDFDLWDGEAAIDTLIKNTDPSLVCFELDVGWSWRAGTNAEDLIRRYAGRFPLIHVKETNRTLGPEDRMDRMFGGIKRDADGKPIFTPEIRARMEEFMKMNCKLGEGMINIPALSKTADAQGTEAYVVEREYAYTGDIFSSVKEDLEYLLKI